MSEKYYMEKDSEMCFTIEDFNDRILDGEKKVHLELAKRAYGVDAMWCTIRGETIEKGDNDCGNLCSNYSPCNGKSGRCRYLANSFTGTGKFFTLTKNGLKAK